MQRELRLARSSHDACVLALRSGEGRLLEGTVEHFEPLQSLWSARWSESFVVNGVRVSYPLLARGCGFHNTLIEGGPIRPGMRVRVTEWHGELLRVEVDSAAMKPPPHRHAHL